MIVLAQAHKHKPETSAARTRPPMPHPHIDRRSASDGPMAVASHRSIASRQAGTHRHAHTHNQPHMHAHASVTGSTSFANETKTASASPFSLAVCQGGTIRYHSLPVRVAARHMTADEEICTLDESVIALIKEKGRRLGTWDHDGGEASGADPPQLHAWRSSKQVPDEERPVIDSVRGSVRRAASARSARSASSSSRGSKTSAKSISSSKRSAGGRLLAISEEVSRRAISEENTASRSSAISVRSSATARTMGTTTGSITSSRTSPHVNVYVNNLRTSSARTWEGLPVRTDLYSGFVPPTGTGQAEKRLIQFRGQHMSQSVELHGEQPAAESGSASPLRSRAPLMMRSSGQKWRAGTRAVAQKPLVVRKQVALDSSISDLRPVLPAGSSVYIIAQQPLGDESSNPNAAGVVRACVVDDLRLCAPILGWVTKAKRKEVLLQPVSSSAAPVSVRGDHVRMTLAGALEQRQRAWETAAWRLHQVPRGKGANEGTMAANARPTTGGGGAHDGLFEKEPRARSSAPVGQAAKGAALAAPARPLLHDDQRSRDDAEAASGSRKGDQASGAVVELW